MFLPPGCSFHSFYVVCFSAFAKSRCFLGWLWRNRCVCKFLILNAHVHLLLVQKLICSSSLTHLVFWFQDEPLLDLHYFINIQGLRGEGREVKSLQEGDVSIEEICEIFGPRKDKNGWKVNEKSSREFQESVLNLYSRVTLREQVLNDQLTLEWARAIVAENKGIPVNWASFAVHLHKRRVSLENVKKAKKLAKEGTGSDSLKVTTLSGPERGIQPTGSSISQLPVSAVGVATQQCPPAQVPQSSGSFLGPDRKSNFRTPVNRSLLLQRTKVKVETGVSVKRNTLSVFRGGVKAMMSSDPPKLGTEDIITRLHELLLSKQKTLLQSKERLRATCASKSNFEMDFKRAKLMLDVLKGLHTDAEGELSRARVALQDALSVESNHIPLIDASGVEEENVEGMSLGHAHQDEFVAQLQQRLRCEERNVQSSLSKLSVAEKDFILKENELSSSEEAYADEVQHQLVLEKMLTLIADYLSKLKGGILLTTHPEPIGRADRTKSQCTQLNVEDCSFCKESFHLNDICVSSCGHCYHPWCLGVHITSSNKCKLQSCQQEFDSQWRLSFGYDLPKNPDHHLHSAAMSGELNSLFS